MSRALALLVLALPALATAAPVSCPQFLPQGAVDVSHPPAGWIGSSPSPARLNGAGLMSGHPKLMNYLKPARMTKARGISVATWQFDAGEEKWLYCSYGTSAIQIARRMDDAATKCTVTVKEERRAPVTEMTVECSR